MDGSQTALCQQNHLGHGVVVDVADAFQAGLHNLLEAVGVFGDAVDVFGIEHLAHGVLSAGVFYNGERHVGLQSHQAAVGVAEGQNLLTGEKVFVLNVQVVFLKLADLVLAVAIGAVKILQRPHDPLVRFHWCLVHYSMPRCLSSIIW